MDLLAEIVLWLVRWGGIVVLVFFTLLVFTLIFLFVLSLFDMYRRLRQNYYSDYEVMARSRFTFPISVLIPAYNEEKTIVDCVESVLSLDYREHEVLVINDGSRDGTLERLIRHFNMVRRKVVYRRSIDTDPVTAIYKSETHPKLTVIDKDHSGKSESLNVGINVARYPLFCSIDADSIFQENALLRVVRPILEDPERVVAVGGQVRVANGCLVKDGRVTEPRMPPNTLASFQVVEYLRAFVASRLGLSKLNNLLIISGVFSLFRKDVVVEVGGYKKHLTEDMELVIRIHRHMRERKRDYAAVFLPDPICWTQVPTKMKSLWSQRSRWHRGLMSCILSNKRLLFNPRYGGLAFVGMPYYLFFEMLGPLVELLGYVLIPIAGAAGALRGTYFLLFLALAVGAGTMLSMLAVLMEELSFGLYRRWRDLGKMFLFAFLENFGYRQITLIMRLAATVEYLRGRQEWGSHEREDFNNDAGEGASREPAKGTRSAPTTTR